MLACRRHTAWPLDLLNRELSDLFTDIGVGFDDASPVRARSFPALNVWQDADKLYADLEAPWFDMDNLEVSVIGDELTITGRRGDNVEDSTEFIHRERTSVGFRRTITLPVDVDAEKIEARLKDGVLTIELPKAQTAKTRKIPVRRG